MNLPLPSCPKPLIPAIAAAATALALAGCGGGGSGNGFALPPAAAPASQAPAPATIPAPAASTAPAPAPADNTAPVSNAGAAQSTTTGATIELDGSASADADGDKLTYAWTLVSKPAGSAAVLGNADSAKPTLIPDMAGNYVASLVVRDGKADSQASTVTVNVEAQASVAFDAIPAPLPANMPSYAFMANTIHALGERITLAAGTPRLLKGINVAMSSWACESGQWTNNCVTTPGTSFKHPITLNLYDANGGLIATRTQEFSIPFRPTPTAGAVCPEATQWRAADGTCNNGMAFKMAFDFSDLKKVLPDTFTFEVAFETSRDQKLAAGGGYDSLNVGAYPVAKTRPTLGSTPQPGYLSVNGILADETYEIMGQVIVTTP